MTPCIDTHQHLWDPSRFSYSWMADLPTLNLPHLLPEYRHAAAGLDLRGTVYVDTDVDEKDLADEVALIFALADDPANCILGVVAGAKLERPAALAHLEPFRDHPKLKGVRRVLHTQDEALMASPAFLANLEELAARGLTFDLCVLPSQLAAALKLVDRFPDLTFVLDHCGNPEVAHGAGGEWKDHLSALAERGQVVCKISGMAAGTGQRPWDPAVFQPVIEHVIAVFGWSRVLWGGDWPVCTLACSLQQWFDAVQAATASASADEKAALFFQNAQRVYRLEHGRAEGCEIP